MQLKITPNDYAKIAVGLSAVIFVISAVLSFVWWNDSGLTDNTVIAIVCAVVSAVLLGISTWILAKFTRAERLENVEINLKYVPGDPKTEKKMEKSETTYKFPKP